MANITKLEELKVDNIEVKNTEVHNGSTTEGTVTLKLDRISGECWGGLSWDLLFPRLVSETGREYLASQGWVEDQHFRSIPNTEFEFGLKVTNLDEAIVFTHLLEGSSEPLVDWSLYTEDEDGGAIGVISYQNALKFVDQYGNEGSGRLRLDTDGITMSGTTYYNNGTLNLTNSTIEVNGNTGTAGQVLTSTGSGLEWKDPSGGSIDTSYLLSWDPEIREISDLGYGSWTVGSTTWYEEDDAGDDSAEQYVRISPLGPNHVSGLDSDFYITARYNENEFLGLNPWAVYIHRNEEDSAAFTPWGISIWYDRDSDSANGAEAYNLNFPVGVDYIGGDYTLATEEYVTNRLGRVPKIYATESGTTTVGTLRVYTDSDGYLHIKTS